MRVAVSLLMLSACGKDLDTGSTEDLTEPPDTLLAPVDEPSNGECPDMTQSNTGVFSSANADRTVTMVIPQEVTDSMPLVYFFHGLMDPGSTPNPTAFAGPKRTTQTTTPNQKIIIGSAFFSAFEASIWEAPSSSPPPDRWFRE